MTDQRRNRLARASYAWGPGKVAALQGSQGRYDSWPMYDPTEYNFGISQSYEAGADGGGIATGPSPGKPA